LSTSSKIVGVKNQPSGDAVVVPFGGVPPVTTRAPSWAPIAT
jgi:hypothetical protein